MSRLLKGVLGLALLAALTCGPAKAADETADEAARKAKAAADLRNIGRVMATLPTQNTIMASLEKAAAFLAKEQNSDGGWGQQKGQPVSDVGITGLAIEALARMPAGLREKNKDLIERGVKYLLANRRDDGAIVNKDGQVANYRTTIATRALIAVDKEKHKDVIDGAVKYTKGIQGKDPKDKGKFGAMGYGSDPSAGDIINTSEAIEMLKQAGVGEDDPAFKDAMVFLGRTQNLDEQAETGVKTANDGGAIYRSVRTGIKDPSKAGMIKLPDGTEVPRSYGGATYNLLKDLLFLGLPKDNVRVKAAYQWICDHYTVKEHPEMGKQGLYYFYYTMARTLEQWGSPTITSGRREHLWAKELGEQIISLQKDNGSWVNEQDKWWEGDATLVTSYTMSSLRICYEMLQK